MTCPTVTAWAVYKKSLVAFDQAARAPEAGNVVTLFRGKADPPHECPPAFEAADKAMMEALEAFERAPIGSIEGAALKLRYLLKEAEGFVIDIAESDFAGAIMRQVIEYLERTAGQRPRPIFG